MRDGRIVEVMEVVGVEGSRVLFERFLPLHDTVLKTVSCSAWRGLARFSIATLACRPRAPSPRRARAFWRAG